MYTGTVMSLYIYILYNIHSISSPEAFNESAVTEKKVLHNQILITNKTFNIFFSVSTLGYTKSLLNSVN